MKPSKNLLYLFLLAMFTWWLRYHPIGMDALVFDEDARQHVYWTARLHDGQLFPDDPMTDFVSSYKVAPLGYRFVYWLGTYLAEPLLFSRCLSLLLLLASVGLLERLMKEWVSDPKVRLVCASLFLFYLTHNVVHNPLGGFQRSFAFPLLLGFLLLLERGHRRRAVFVIVLETIFYPPIVPNTVALIGAEMLTGWEKETSRRRWIADALFLAAILVLSGILLSLIYGAVDRELVGNVISLERAKAMPEFYAGGRSVFFQENPLAYFLTGRSGIGVPQFSGFLIILAIMAATLGFRRLKFPPLVVHLIWTSLVLFCVAHLVLFKLFLPSRYTYYTLSIALILLIGIHATSFLKRISERWVGFGDARPRLPRWMAWGMAVLLLATYAVAQSRYICRADPRLAVLEREELDMLDFLTTLPKDALVAGHPADMDNVPLIARRKVLANGELALPYYTTYYALMKERIFESLRAHYATSWEEIRSFVDRYAIHALVVNKQRLEKGLGSAPIFYEPFNSDVKEWIGKNGDFVLPHAPQALRCFENGRYVVLCFSKSRETIIPAPLATPRQN